MLTAPRSAECGGNRVWRELTPRVRFTRQRLRENLDAYLMISPWLIGFVGLTVGPVLGSAVLAFTQWNLLSPPRLIGTENFGTLLADDLFWTSLYNTGYYTAFGVPVYILLALLAAVASALVWIWNRDEVRTVALGIALSKGLYASKLNYLMATSTAMTLPIVALFFFAQRYFMKGIVLTGLAGR